MNKRELDELIKKGESSTLEFKRKISSYEKIAKEISAFANTIGGYLIVGVDDDGSIVGVQSEKTVIDQIETACGFYIEPPIEPQIEINVLRGFYLIVCYISESNNKPHFIIDSEGNNTKKVYIRVGEKSVLASKEMRRVLSGTNSSASPVRLVIGKMEKRLFQYLENHERITVGDYARLVNISNRRAERLLVRLVKAGVIQIHIDTVHDYFTLVEEIT